MSSWSPVSHTINIHQFKNLLETKKNFFASKDINKVKQTTKKNEGKMINPIAY